MTAQQSPTFQIPKDVIEPIIVAQVGAAVAQAMQGHTQLLERAVAQVLTQKVDVNGNPRAYGNAVEYIQWLMQQCIRAAVKQALETELVKHRDTIKQTLVDQLKRKNSPFAKQIAEGLLDAVVNSETLTYRIKVELDR